MYQEMVQASEDIPAIFVTFHTFQIHFPRIGTSNLLLENQMFSARMLTGGLNFSFFFKLSFLEQF